MPMIKKLITFVMYMIKFVLRHPELVVGYALWLFGWGTGIYTSL